MFVRHATSVLRDLPEVQARRRAVSTVVEVLHEAAGEDVSRLTAASREALAQAWPDVAVPRAVWP